MFTFDDTTIGIWFISMKGADYMSVLTKDKDKDVHQLKYRFRIYLDDKTHDSKDIKDWGCRRSHPGQYTDEQAIEEVRKANSILLKLPDTKQTEILRNGRTTEEMFEEFVKQPFVHIRPVPVPGQHGTERVTLH